LSGLASPAGTVPVQLGEVRLRDHEVRADVEILQPRIALLAQFGGFLQRAQSFDQPVQMRRRVLARQHLELVERLGQHMARHRGDAGPTLALQHVVHQHQVAHRARRLVDVVREHARAQFCAQLRRRRRLVGRLRAPALGERQLQLAVAPLQAERSDQQALQSAQRPRGAVGGAAILDRLALQPLAGR
jgi:hypothetical protein